MGNIIDYARTETRDFGELPFREADALVLAQLSYDDVPECVPRLDDIESRYGTLHDRVKQFDPRHPIRSVRMLRKPPFDGVTIARADDELHHGSAVPDHNVENVGLVDPQVTHDFYHAIAANPRFSGIEMGAFLEQFDGEEQTQFAAVTYLLPSGALVVAYRGTDDSLVGWKEDFNMAFQYPVEIPGVSNQFFLQSALNAVRNYRGQEALDRFDFQDLMEEKIKLLQMPEDLLTRSVNVGFSGGEKKRNDILQMAVLEPELCILDESDSGLDIDALKIVSQGVNALRDGKRAFIIVTHYQRILDYIKPDYVHVLYQGRIVKSGDFTLVKQLEEQGYGWLTEQQ